MFAHFSIFSCIRIIDLLFLSLSNSQVELQPDRAAAEKTEPDNQKVNRVEKIDFCRRD